MAIDIEAPGAHEADLKAALLELAPFRGARVRRTSDQTTANYSTETAIPWQEAVVDTDTFWSAGAPSRLTIPAAYNGKHATAQANVRISLGTADSFVHFRLTLKDSAGTTKFSSPMSTEVGTDVRYANATLIGVPVVTGDYFEASIDEETDTSITVVSGHWSGMGLQIIG